MSRFELHYSSPNSGGRLGQLNLKHGLVATPIFMPVGTAGSVKSLVSEELEDLGAEIILGNTYHLNLRPGMEVISSFGGLHKFMDWKKPILTDSGGFQVFSLAKLRKTDENGCHFRSHIDGSEVTLSPEIAVQIQETIGADIHMIFDECTAYPVSYDEAKSSMERSLRWAKRCKDAKKDQSLCQFGIVQGGMEKDLRLKSIEKLVELDFEGYAIGGLSVGEPKELMRELTQFCCDHLPKDKPRYLMGVGTPLDIVESIALGIDMFDCVMPSRNARNGSIFTSVGKLNIKNQVHRLDQNPLDPDCKCFTCTRYSRAYLRHLFVSSELTVYRLLTIHNLAYYLRLIADCRAAISANNLPSLVSYHQSLWQ